MCLFDKDNKCKVISLASVVIARANLNNIGETKGRQEEAC